MATPRLRYLALLTAVLPLATACSGDGGRQGGETPAAEAPSTAPPNAMARALAGGGTVFVIRPSELTAEQGKWVTGIRDADYVFTTLERGPWDMPGLTDFLKGRDDAVEASMGSTTRTPVLLRIPPLHELGADTAGARVEEALAAGVDGIIFPHIQSPEEAVTALDALGSDGWPRNPTGSVVAVHMIEDRVSVENAHAIVGVPGVKVIFLGPMSLTSSYEGDDVAVENAIQSVLAVCKDLDVACGITAGADDVAERVRQGFRFLVVREQAVLDAGRAALGATSP